MQLVTKVIKTTDEAQYTSNDTKKNPENNKNQRISPEK